MSKLYLVRHGKASSAFDEAVDPGLSDEGREAAVDLALKLEPLGPLPIFCSPLKRAQETAAPLANRWSTKPQLSSAVSEIPTPAEIAAGGVQARGAWLRQLSGQRYPEQPGLLRAWRQGILGTLLSCRTDMVIVTHFMVINAAIGFCLGDDRLVLEQPDYCSVNVVENSDGRLTLIERGTAAVTRVL